MGNNEGQPPGRPGGSLNATCSAQNGSLLFLFKKKYPETGQSLPAQHCTVFGGDALEKIGKGRILYV